VLTLALGIGANSTVFTAVNAILFHALPVASPSQLTFVNFGDKEPIPMNSYPDYRDLRDRNHTLSGLVGFAMQPMALSSGGRNERIWGYLASGNYFDILGVHPLLGRFFTPAEDTNRASPVAVLSYACWMRRFGGDPSVLGKNVKLNGLDYTILGVAGREFTGTEIYFLPDIWLPLSMAPRLEGTNWLLDRSDRELFVLGRLKNNVRESQAQADLNVIASELSHDHPKEDAGMRVTLSAPGLAGAFLRDATITFFSALLILAGLILLIACTNLAGLMLARSVARRRETAICLAIGAGRKNVITQLLSESLLLSLAGAALGLVLAYWLTSALASVHLPTEIPLNISAQLDMHVLWFTVTVAVITTVVFGFTPAFEATRTDVMSGLRNESAFSGRRWHLRDLLVTAQIVLSVVMLVASALVIRGLQRALNLPLGFQPNRVLTAAIDLPMQGYDENRGRAFQRHLLDRLNSLQGVERAGFASALPLSLDVSLKGVYIEGRPQPKPAEAPLARVYSISPGYFASMQTRLLHGRDFDLRDKPGSERVVIVNQAFTDRFFPNQEALGKRFRYDPQAAWMRIVGIVETGKYFSLSESPQPVTFRPSLQEYNGDMAVVLRSRLPEAQALQQLRSAMLSLDASLAIFSAGPLREQLGIALLPARVGATALAAFGTLALLLAAIGLYGVMAYAVARRTREIGIRIALGASVQEVLRSVLRRTVLMLLVGCTVGCVIALAASSLLETLLYGVSPRDPAALISALVAMAAVALAATYLPARRATRIDPANALRQE